MELHNSTDTFVAEDLFDFTFVSSPRVSPQGDHVAFVSTTVDAGSNCYNSHISIVPLQGGAPRPYTAGYPREVMPRWSPDGRYLAFLSDRDLCAGSTSDAEHGLQIYILSTAGGEAQPVTMVPGGVREFAWSPDSKRLAFRALVGNDSPKPSEQAHFRPAGNPETCNELVQLFDKYNEDVRRISDIRYKLDGEGYLEDKKSHIFVLNIDDAMSQPERHLADPRQVTSGHFDHGDFAWSPDGSRLAISVYREEGLARHMVSDLWVFYLEEEREPLKLTESLGPVAAPAWSPDGMSIAYLGHEHQEHWYSNTDVWVVSCDGSGKPRCLTASCDRSFRDESLTDLRVSGSGPQLKWSVDGRRVFALASHRGTTHLHDIDVDSGRVRQITDGGYVVFDYDLHPEQGVAVLAIAKEDSPNDLFLLNLDESTPSSLRQLTWVNDELLSGKQVVLPERFSVETEEGVQIDGWALKPVGAVEGKTYPAVLEIHGGPTAMYTGSFFFEFQLLCAAGIGVVFTNPRGSQGYGQDFCAAIRGNWGYLDYRDVMAGMETALDRFDWIDPDRLGVAGGSYGGYMTSWIIGHTDRFRAACSMRAINNMYSAFGDIGYMRDEYWADGKPPWAAPEVYLEQSPLSFADNFKTPTLVIHSEDDYRCPIEQAEQLFVALKKAGVAAEFIRFPGESHGLSRNGQPWHRVYRLKSIVDWFERYLSGNHHFAKEGKE